MDLATGCHHPAREEGWRHNHVLNICRSLQHAGHSWNPALEQQGCVEGLTAVHNGSSEMEEE